MTVATTTLGGRLALGTMDRCALRRRSAYSRNLILANRMKEGCAETLEYVRTERLPRILSNLARRFHQLSTVDLDVIHGDTWSAVWESIWNYKPEYDLDGWLYGIARHVTLKYCEAWYPLDQVELVYEPVWDRCFDDDDRPGPDTSRIVQKAICQLPSRQQTLVRMDMAGDTTTEIQTATGCSTPSAVYNLRQRAYVRLRTILAEWLPHLDIGE